MQIWDALWFLFHRFVFTSYVFTKTYRFNLYYCQFTSCRNVIWLIHTNKEKLFFFWYKCFILYKRLNCSGNSYINLNHFCLFVCLLINSDLYLARNIRNVSPKDGILRHQSATRIQYWHTGVIILMARSNKSSNLFHYILTTKLTLQ